MLSRTILLGAAAAAVVTAPGIAGLIQGRAAASSAAAQRERLGTGEAVGLPVLGNQCVRVHHTRRVDVHVAALRRLRLQSARSPGAPEGANWSAESGRSSRSSPTSPANPFAKAGDIKPLPAELAAVLPDVELRQRRQRDDVRRQPEPGGLRAQPGGQLDCGRGQSTGGPARGNEPLLQLTQNPSRAPRGRASRRPGRGRRPRRLSRG